MASKPDIKALYYITHRSNLRSILEKGILSHRAIDREQLPREIIYNKEVVARRGVKITPDNQSLWEYANLYFQPRNPMMYQVTDGGRKTEDIIVLEVSPEVLRMPGVCISDGNAANSPSRLYHVAQGMKIVRTNWKIIQSEYWKQEDGSKRQIMAECLVPERITPDYIKAIYVAKKEYREEIEQIASSAHPSISVSAEPNMFFNPTREIRLDPQLSIHEGDMFFSKAQTLTISVNVVGVMGKGLASRAKYQFPDVYVQYQDACKKKRIQPGKPYIYKREGSLEQELLDAPEGRLVEEPKWFLLFPTKRHWRDKSRLEDIDAGLSWLQDHYKKEGIESLALPALGCGLGGLSWRQVGPRMCSYLVGMDIRTLVYLPQGQAIPKEELTAAFLLP